jgi:hypothetical protein
LHDISPSKDRIVAFDVSVIADEDTDKRLKAGVTLVAATQNDERISQVFTSFVPAESLTTSASDLGRNRTTPVWKGMWTFNAVNKYNIFLTLTELSRTTVDHDHGS